MRIPLQALIGLIALCLYIFVGEVHAQSSENASIAFKTRDFATALSEYILLAMEGDVKAQERLGWMYRNGLGTPVDLQQSLIWFQKSAAQGNIPAQAELGWIYKEGRGVEKNDQQSVMWFSKAAESGNASAQYGLGLDYASGQGVAVDEKQAIEWLEKAAKQGHAKSGDKLLEVLLDSSTHFDLPQTQSAPADEKLTDFFDIFQISGFSGFWNNLNNGSSNNFEFHNINISQTTFTASIRILASGQRNSDCNIEGSIIGKMYKNIAIIHIDPKNQKCTGNYSIALNLETKTGIFSYTTLGLFSRKLFGQYRIIDTE